MRKTPWICLLMSGWLLCGCAATPYRAPVSLCQAGPAARTPEAWWQGFSDPRLLALLAEVDRCNVDLARKALEWRASQLAVGRSAIEARGGLSAHERRPLEGGSALRGHSLDLSVSYEIDLWGRVARGREADAWLAQAHAAELRALRLSLQADVASAYWLLAARLRQQALQRERVSLSAELARLEARAAEIGAQPARVAREQRQAWLAAQAERSRLDAQVQAQRERLAALLDRPTQNALEAVLQAARPEVPEGLPSDLLRRRPDLAAEEARLRRQMARKDEAQARLMPAFSLTASLGAASTSLRQWLSDPVGGLLGSLTLPFLDGHNLAIARDQAQLEVESAAAAYRRVVNRALREVEDALDTRQRLRQEGERAEAGLVLARRDEREAEVRRQAGDADRRTVIQARMQRLEQEQQWVGLQAEQNINLALLYKVMGGAPGTEGKAPPRQP